MRKKQSLLRWMLSRWRPKSAWPAAAVPATPTPFSQMVTFGRTRRSAEGAVTERAEVIFTDPETGARHKIVDEAGRICHFPGFADKDRWIGRLSNRQWLQPVVRFRTSFEVYGDGYVMLWQIQPDGRYWGDSDGFGWEDDDEITLYAQLDGRGRFTGPFRLYPDKGLHGV